MCGDEFHEDGLDHEQLKEIAQAMSETGLIDYLGVIGSGADTHNTLANCMPPMALPPEPFVHLAAGIKSVVKLPVMHAQSIRDAGQAERLLASGMVDLVGMTRAQIADPHMVIKIRDGREDEIKQCVGANYCIDRQYNGLDVLCVQNAATSREATMPHVIAKTRGPKRKVVVVGAGPAGLEAARVAKSRGHDVVLFEKNDYVGGQIMLAAKAPQREQMAGIVRWFDMETKRLGVDRRLGVAADEKTIMAEKPDIVVLATGGSAFTSQVAAWGVDEGLAVSSWDVLSGKVEPGKNVLVYDGVSTHAGAGVADFMSSRGSNVEIVTPDVKVADDVGGTTFPIFYRRLYAQGVIHTPNYWLDKVYEEDGKKIAVIRNEYTEEQEERAVDQVVIENGSTPNDRALLDAQAGVGQSRSGRRAQAVRVRAAAVACAKNSAMAASCCSASATAFRCTTFTARSTTRCAFARISDDEPRVCHHRPAVDVGGRSRVRARQTRRVLARRPRDRGGRLWLDQSAGDSEALLRRSASRGGARSVYRAERTWRRPAARFSRWRWCSSTTGSRFIRRGSTS